MEQLKIRLAELFGEKEISKEQLLTLKGGYHLEDGCQSYVCSEKRSGAKELCSGGVWCTSAVGPERPKLSDHF